MVDLIEQSMMAIDELVEALGRATIEAVLEISAAPDRWGQAPGEENNIGGWLAWQRAWSGVP